MHRIDTPTALIDKFGPGKNGFVNGNKATGRRATDLNSDMWDAVQEELANAIEGVGITLDKSKHNQLFLAIQKAIDDKGFLEKSKNLSDLSNKAEARRNLDIYSRGEVNETFLQKEQNGADIPDKARFIENLGLRDTVIGATDTLLGKNNTWTATNKFIGGLGVGAPAGSLEGGQIDLDDKDGGRAYFIDIDADGNFRVVRSGNDSGITTNAMFQLMRATNEAWIRSTLNVEGGIKATGSIHAGNAAMGTDGNIVGSIWNGGNLAAHLSTIGGVKNVARGAQVAVGLGESTLTQSWAAPAGCFLNGFTHVSAGTGSGQFWRRALTQIFYRPVMINDGQRWLQIGDIA